MQLIRLILLASWLAGAGCASTPDPIRDADNGPSLGDVLDAPREFVGERVRWGGTIASVENGVEKTRVYLVARTLYDSGRPKPGDVSAGRFVALLSGFHDPVILAPGRELTAVGVLHDATSATIGEFEYRYPVVVAEIYRLWPKRNPPAYYYGPPYYPYYYYDPWYPYPYFAPRRFY